METNPLRSLFWVSSPRTEAQGVAPQPAAPTENICYEFPLGMLEKLLVNPFTRDGTSNPNLHLIHVDEVFVYLSLQVCLRMRSRRRSFP